MDRTSNVNTKVTEMSRSGRRGLRSSRDNNEESNMPSSNSQTNSVATPSEHQASNNQHSSTRTIRDGYNPKYPHLRVLDCMCSTPGQCRNIMKRWANINATHMFPYVSLPKMQKKSTPLTMHLEGYRENVVHHFYGHLPDASAIKADALGSGKQHVFAMWHLPPTFRPYVLEKGSSKMHWWRIPRNVGEEQQQTERDLCQKIKKDDEKTYYPSPRIHNIKDGIREVEVAEREYHGKNNQAALKTPNEDNSVASTARTTPTERRIEQVSRLMKLNPGTMSKQFVKQENELEELRLELVRVKKEAEERENELKKANEREKSDFINGLQKHGLNRMSLCNDEYHQSKPWLAPHLYGSSWNEHKQFGNALFGADGVEYMLERDEGFLRKELSDLVQKDWSVNVSGEGDITPFEQYSICCMIARRDFPQETVAGMYDVRQNSISRYMSKWAPLLGVAGRDMSELDMELNHNIFPVEDCKKDGLPYIDEKTGKGHTLEEYNHMSNEELTKLMEEAKTSLNM